MEEEKGQTVKANAKEEREAKDGKSDKRSTPENEFCSRDEDEKMK